MGRDLGPDCRLCRREGEKLFLKGARCYTHKCAVARREYAPGQHGAKKTKLSNFGIQLREKQKVKRMYGLLEKQFHRTYEKAQSLRGNTGVNLLTLLESRLDTVVYRMGFASTRAEARQLVGHRGIVVDGTVLDIPSARVMPGQTVAVREKAKKQLRIADALKLAEGNGFPAWVQVDPAKMEAVFKKTPDRDEFASDINESLIVELYSR